MIETRRTRRIAALDSPSASAGSYVGATATLTIGLWDGCPVFEEAIAV